MTIRSRFTKNSFLKALSLIAYFAMVAAYGISVWPSRHIFTNHAGGLTKITGSVPSIVLAEVITPSPTLIPTPIPHINQTPSLTPAVVQLPITVPPIPGKKNAKGGLPILMYHYVGRVVDPKKDELGWKLSVTGDAFEQQLQFLEQHGYHTVTMADYSKGTLPAHSIALTFDDGYADAYTQAFPRLKAHGMVGTFYLITGKTDDHYVTHEQIKEMQAAGMEMAAHTVTHRDLKNLPVAEQWKEISGSKLQLESLLGTPVTDFCYPIGHLNQDTLELVRRAGFLTATTTQGGVASKSDDPLLLPRLRMGPYTNLTWMQREIPF